MSNETFKTNHGNVPKLTEENYPVWKQRSTESSSPRKPTISSPVSNSSLLATASPYTFYKKAGMTEQIKHQRKYTSEAATNSFHSSTISTTPWKCGKHSGTDLTMPQRNLASPKSCGSSPPLDYHQMNGHPVLCQTTRLPQEANRLRRKYVLEQRIPTPTAHQCMDAIREYAE